MSLLDPVGDLSFTAARQIALESRIAQLELELRVVRRKLEDERERRHVERAEAYRHGVLDGLDARLVQMRRALGDKVANYEPIPLAVSEARPEGSDSGCPPAGPASNAERVSPHPAAAGVAMQSPRGTGPGACHRDFSAEEGIV